MRIALSNVYARVLSYSAKEDQFLDDLLCVPVPGHKFMPAYKVGNWDGLKHFYSSTSKYFPTGFLPIVAGEAEKRGLTLDLDDQRFLPPLSDPTTVKERYPHLRDYQVRGIEQALTHTLQIGGRVLPWQRGVLKFPTGSGKTILAACLIDFIGKKTLYVVERKELMYQTFDAFKTQTSMTLGLLGDGKMELSADITFAMAQTVRSKLKELAGFLRSVETLVIDEAQHLSKGIYHQIAIKAPAPFRFGFSATPMQRGDLGDVYLVADTGDIIAEGDRQAIEDEGFIAKPRVFMFTVDKPTIHAATYKFAYDALIVRNDYRNDMIVKAVRRLMKRQCSILILVRHIAHGRILARLLKSVGIPCIFVQGADSMKDRQFAKAEIGRSYHVLIATGIFDEGVDMPLIDAGIMAGGGQSKIKSIQRVGRILRPKPSGSNEVFIIDFKDVGNKYLFRHSAERLQAYEDEGFAVSFPERV
jgi:superfamily II DNA or RNA helicase